jgi:hypothetical protein
MFFKNLSPHVERDEDFFQLIRDLTGLSTKKPPTQVRVARGGNGEVRVRIARSVC